MVQINITSPNPFDAQAGASEQMLPLGLRPFHASEAHHVDVLQRHMSGCAYFRHQVVGDQNARPRSHGLSRVSEYCERNVIGPVVEDATEVVDESP